MYQYFIPFYDCIIFHCICIPQFVIHLSIDGYLFLPFAVANSATINMHVQVCIWVPVFSCFGYIPRSGIAGSYGNSVFNFYLFFKIFIYFYLFRLCRVLVAACLLLSCIMYVGSSSPTRDQTQAPCIGSTESYPLDHQGSPYIYLLEEPQIVFHSGWNILHYHHSIWSFPFLCVLPTLFIFHFWEL